MFKNYFNTALRYLFKFKMITAINVAGLSIGLASSFIIILFVMKEINYDTYNDGLNNIYLMSSHNRSIDIKSFLVPHMLAPITKEHLPEIKKIARIYGIRGTIKVKDKVFTGDVCKSVDPEIFDILTLPLKSGKKEMAFQNKNSIVISEKMALKYFGTKYPTGEIITFVTGMGYYDLTVSGIMKDIPEESTFKADLLIPLSLGEEYIKALLSNSNLFTIDSWNYDAFNVYVLMNKNVNIDEFNNKIKILLDKQGDSKSLIDYSLFPLKNVYFNSSEFKNNRYPQGNLTNVYIYSAIAVLILLIVSINYIILSMGTANTRTKEIGVRKVIGAKRINIVIQVMSESILTASIAIPIALLLVEIALPWVSKLLGKELSTDYFHNIKYIILLSVISFIVGIISGSYISMFMSKYNPIDIIRNKFDVGKKRTIFRKSLIVFQMIIFIGLIFSSLIAYKQLQYLYNKDFGFNKDELLVFYGKKNLLRDRFDAFKNILKNNPNILSVSGASDIPGTESQTIGTFPRKDDPTKEYQVEMIEVDGDFLKTMQMQIVAGCDFNNANTEKTKHEVILNETAVKMLNIMNPIKDTIMGMEIIGVVKDFNFHSLHENVPPLLIIKDNKYIEEIIVKVKPNDILGTTKYIKENSKEYNDGKIMDGELFDERIAQLYVKEERFGKVIAFFTGLSVFVAGLGLFGMSIFVVQQRIKEISMRKVLGASYWEIMFLLSKEFILSAIIATVITIPLAIYLISGWLERFAFRIDINISTILITTVIAVIITIVTTGVKIYGAAKINPISNLKNE